MKIAILSSASEAIAKENKIKISKIVSYLKSKAHVEIMTGGSKGIPGLFIEEAKSAGLKTIGYSPDKDGELHAKRFDNQDLSYFDTVYHYNGFTLRSLKMLESAEAVLVLNGRMGTLSEFAIALEEGKRVGVITKTGVVADELERLVEISQKDFSGRVFFGSDYHEVLDWLLNT